MYIDYKLQRYKAGMASCFSPVPSLSHYRRRLRVTRYMNMETPEKTIGMQLKQMECAPGNTRLKLVVQITDGFLSPLSQNG